MCQQTIQQSALCSIGMQHRALTSNAAMLEWVAYHFGCVIMLKNDRAPLIVLFTLCVASDDARWILPSIQRLEICKTLTTSGCVELHKISCHDLAKAPQSAVLASAASCQITLALLTAAFNGLQRAANSGCKFAHWPESAPPVRACHIMWYGAPSIRKTRQDHNVRCSMPYE